MILHTIFFVFLNQINGKIPGSGVIDEQTINTNWLCYQCSKYGSDFLFGKFRIRNSRDKPYFPAKRKLLSCQIRISTLFKNSYGRK